MYVNSLPKPLIIIGRYFFLVLLLPIAFKYWSDNAFKPWARADTRILNQVVGVCSLENCSVAYEETRSNRASDFRDFVCYLFPKAILFYFYLNKGM